MSNNDSEKLRKSLHIVFGTLEENCIKDLSAALISKGYESPIIIKKTLKESIVKYLNEHRDVDVLIVQEYMESNNGYQVYDYAKCLDIIDNLKIIPILTEERRNTSYVNELYKNQILTALFSDATIGNIVQLITKGRSRIEAREYYGVNLNDFSDEVDRKGTVKDEYSSLSEENGSKENSTQNNSEMKKGETAKSLEKIGSVNFSLQEAIKKVVIGFSGVQTHIGATYQTLSFAHYLAENKYKVAVVEDSSQRNLCFQYITSNHESQKKDFGFTYKGIDYYPNYDLTNLSKVIIGDYNFVLIDFGLFRKEMLHEFNRCVIPIVISGSKTWEIPQLDRVFSYVEEEELLKSYYYLFTFAATSAKKLIKKNMGVIRNVYFTDNIVNPASGEGYAAMKQILSRYLPYLPENKEKGVKPLDVFKRLFE